MTQQQLDDLVGRLDVIDAFYRYARAVDERDWDAMADLFTEDVIVRFDGPARGILPVRLDGREEFLTEFRTFFGICGSTYHVSMNHEVRVDGDVATARAAYRDLDERVDGEHVLCVENLGFFDARLVRTPHGWQFTELHGTTVISRGATEEEIFAPVVALETTRSRRRG
ncbi:MAG: nuclear transport factor 2 family protein [Pseudonocardia sp.]|uniref:nuclear transport factor 2 family protein n=1 Tax=unclassified Pseudonocardia TaxID=2619320 RepID=UPI00086D3E6E|nr:MULTISPECIES: nuclear transport factor 2 family protein [unclassified Pseudonocardia]MBN9109422.1 nuclear transport factor 2 family protein [Pseudonocardia sp.]ODU29937.1 MAG: hypothetical protein ABS80_00965 [Pseudonocardia sp. SCN 72-51]ODV08125.1 MAG: hypothetical protein ABT15_05435 [Pseudonocardia sp. SCN 73-27]